MDTQIPYSDEAEQATLGAILIHPPQFPSLAGFLKPDDFFILRHRYIWEAMTRLNDQSQPIDVILLCDQLKAAGQLDDIGGPAYLTQLSNSAPNSQHGHIYASLVETLGVRRRMLAAADRIKALALDQTQPIDEITTASGKLMYDSMHVLSSRRVVPFFELVQQEFDRVEDLMQHPGKLLGLPTGFTELDKLILGLLPGEITLLGARPGMGKSALAMSIVMNVLRENPKRRIGMFSLEMRADELTRRALSLEGGVNLHAMLSGKLGSAEWSRFVKSAGDISNRQLFIDDWNGLTPAQMEASVRNLEVGYGKLDLIVLDYVQLMTGEGENRAQEISAVSRSLKTIANRFDVPVLAIVSLNRALEMRADKRPVLSDIRDSGQLESDASKVLFLYRDEIYNPATEHPNMAEIIVAKHRNGPTGTIHLYFDKPTARFLTGTERTIDLRGLAS